MRRRDQRKARSEGRGNAPITTAIDETLNDVIGVSLKEDGFRKRGRTWTREIPPAAGGPSTPSGTGATAQPTVCSICSWGSRIPLWASERNLKTIFFVCSPGYLSGYLPPFTFNDVEDKRDRYWVSKGCTDRWSGDYGHAFLNEAYDPQYLLHHLLSDGDSHGIFSVIQRGSRR